MQRLIIVEGDHDEDDEDDEEFLLEHKLGKIQLIPSHTSNVMAINNLKTLTPWSC
jgi:hypothetical protein